MSRPDLLRRAGPGGGRPAGPAPAPRGRRHRSTAARALAFYMFTCPWSGLLADGLPVATRCG